MRRSQAPSKRGVKPIQIQTSKNVTQTVESTPAVENSRIVYNIVIGKKSTKKHKTWDSDGTLEVDNTSAILKDDNGAVIGRLSSIKRELFVEEYIFSHGNKEIQIIDVRNDQVSIPKRKLDQSNSKKLPFITGGPLIKRRSVTLSENDLIMPQPTEEHRWKFNKGFLAITDVHLDTFLSKVLRPHQKQGVIFLYECLMGYRNCTHFGAILADEMGLGKTLQSISVIWILLKRGPYDYHPILKRVLIVTPSSLVENWYKEFNRWLGKHRIRVYKVNLKHKPCDFMKTYDPVMIISYEMFMRYVDDLNSIRFDLMVCDEGHRLKNDQNKTYSILNQNKCRRRLILTGTPIQNDLQEFYALANFVNSDVLGSYSEYRSYFEQIICQSRGKNVDVETKLLGEQRSRELHEKTNSFILRRTQHILDKYLPTKSDLLVFCRMSETQLKLYKMVTDYWFNNKTEPGREMKHLSLITMLKKIVNHPILLLKNDQNDDHNDELTTNIVSLLRPLENEEESQHSGKMKVLSAFLEFFFDSKSEKVVIVSNYTQTLNLVMKLCVRKKYPYCRLDGSTPTAQRLDIVQKFNVSKVTDCYVFLLSAKAGGLGLNLVGGSRLVLLDSDWNPAVDVQAMARIWREGQKKSVYLYRFLSTGTIEEKILQRQLSKINLGKTIMRSQEGQNDSIKFTDEELKDILNLNTETNCLVHSQLECDCIGDGSATINSETVPVPVSVSAENDENQRPYRFNINQNDVTDKDDANNYNEIEQLLNWEHHNYPVNPDILLELGFTTVQDSITFLFKNRSSVDNEIDSV